MSTRDRPDLPEAVILAQYIDWDVYVDAYLMEAARVGDRFAAKAYGDGSGVIGNGATVVTPPVAVIETKGEFMLLRSTDGNDHYVIVSQFHP